MNESYNKNLPCLSDEYIKASELYPFLLPKGFATEMEIHSHCRISAVCGKHFE